MFLLLACCFGTVGCTTAKGPSVAPACYSGKSADELQSVSLILYRFGRSYLAVTNWRKESLAGYPVLAGVASPTPEEGVWTHSGDKLIVTTKSGVVLSFRVNRQGDALLLRGTVGSIAELKWERVDPVLTR